MDEKKVHAFANLIRCIAITKLACSLDKMDWNEVSKIIVGFLIFCGTTKFADVPGNEIIDNHALEMFDGENVSKKLNKLVRILSLSLK